MSQVSIKLCACTQVYTVCISVSSYLYAYLWYHAFIDVIILVTDIMCDSREFCRSSRDSTIGINFDALGDVEHFDHLSGDFYDLYKSGEYTDVTFIVSGVQFHAHKIILAARCAYFKVLLYGRMKEASLGPKAEIPFNDTTPEAFAALLEYVYSGKLGLADLSEEVC